MSETAQTGSRLRELRSLLGVTQVEMAQRAGVTVQTVKSLENGRHNPSLETAQKLASAYGTTIDALFPAEVER